MIYSITKFVLELGRRLATSGEIRRNAGDSSGGGPSLLILGTAKAGTTTLFNLLNSLQGFCGSQRKEIRYFSMDYYYQQGPEFYHSHFTGKPADIQFEATPHYLYFPAVPRRVYSYQRSMRKDMKFIVLLRNPVERCYSAWNMERTFHDKRSMEIIDKHYRYYNPDIRDSLSELLLRKDFPSFPQAVREDLERWKRGDRLLEPSYVRKGIYGEQIPRWLKWFDREKFLFLEFRELSDPLQVLKKVEDFLQTPIEADPAQFNPLHMNAGDYPDLTDENRDTLEMLREFYYSLNEKLFHLLGMRYDWND